MTWKTLLLNDIADVIDSLHKTPKYSENGLPMVRAQEIVGGNLKLDGTALVSEEVFKDFSRNHTPEIGDLVYSRVGAHCGKVSYVNTKEPFCLGQNTVFIVPKKIDSKLLYYIINSPSIKNQIDRNAVVSSYKTISLKTLRNLEIRFPFKEQDQKAVASILSALDDKIENNLQMNKTLEEMALALYKHWFVDFGPFQDGEFVDSELGKIPKGWEVKDIKDFGKVICGKTPSKKDPKNFTDEDSGYPFIKIPEMHGNVFITKTSEWISEEGNKKQKKKLLPAGSINVSCIATVGLVSINSLPAHTNQQINSIVPEMPIFREYLYSAMINLKDRFLNEASGGSATLNMNTTTFSNIEILKPDKNTIKEFSKTIKPTFDKILSNQQENQILSNLRDTLLPKLISGKVRVKDVEKTLSEVL